MQTRYMQRTNSMRGKRSAEGGDDEDQQPERKRPALASVIVEALKVDSLQKLCSSLEPILRRVVSEEVERALAKLGPARLTAGRSSPKCLEGPNGSNLQLQFRTKLSLPLFTGGKVEGEQGAAVHVVLLDASSGCVVTCGPEASIKLDVVVLEGDFNNEDDEDWTKEDFETHVVKEREGKRPLLTGDLQITLKEGVGTLGDLTFTDNSSWIRSRKFRLGLKVASGFCEGIRVREAKTEAFTVKDHRGELYKKHYPPVLTDEVWRLEKIGKDGSFHKRLNNNEIFSVEDFLRLMVRDAAKLRNILGSGMSNKMWDALQEHAKTCVLNEKFYVYYPDNSRIAGVIFNNIYALCGLISGEQYFSADSLSDEQKVFVDASVKKAYENWNEVIEYDGKSHVNLKQGKRSGGSYNDYPVSQLGYSTEPVNPMQFAQLPASVSSSSLLLPGIQTGVLGLSDSTGLQYSAHSQLSIPVSRDHSNISGLVSHEHQMGNSHQIFSTRNDNGVVGLGLGSSQSSSSAFPTVSSSTNPANLNPFVDWSSNRDKGVDEFFTEEEIRMRSHEMLENEDMQHLLRLFSMGGHGSVNMPDDVYGFSSFVNSPMPNFDDRMRPGKAVVGWLKIKAAMRWGFFVRKKAAERRAQLVELDDE